MPNILLKNITKRFGKSVAVDNLSMEIKDGDFVTLLGPSGCGKTTTLRMIAGLETPTEGEIVIDGRTVFDAGHGIDVSPAKRDVGFLFQNYALWPHMTVHKNIAFGLENMKWDKVRIETRVNELLEMLHVETLGERYPAELSGGQQQRVAIARTLAPHPRVLLMDEPLSNLDAKLRMEMRTELKRLHMDTGSTFVYVTHDQLEAMTLSTRVCLMKLGLLQQYSPPLEVYSSPGNTFVADFVGSPTVNLVACVCELEDGNSCVLKGSGLTLRFTAREEIPIRSGQRLILGLRPEHIAIDEQGAFTCQVYSSLPSGMETILRLKLGDLDLNAVIFGNLDFAMGSTVRVSLKGNEFLLFDEASTERIALGSLEQLVYTI